MRAILIALLLAMVTLAGCSGDDSPTEASDDGSGDDSPVDGTPADDPVDDDPDNPEEPEPETGGENQQNETKQNIPPTLSFSSDLAQGDVPLTVTFAIAASDGDGEATSWTFVSGVEGAEPIEGTEDSELEVVYDAEGTYIANVTATDGTDFVYANITITVAAEAVEVPGPLVYSGSSLGSVVLGCFVYDGDIYYYYDGAIAGFWLYTVEANQAAGDVVTEWWNGDSAAGDGGDSGVIPAPSDNVAVCSSLPEPMDFTMTLHHPDYQF